MPEDLTINTSSKAPIPRCLLPGHCWANVVSRNDVTWLVSYIDSSIKEGNHKYV
jgi:DNA topoisomerase-1